MCFAYVVLCSFIVMSECGIFSIVEYLLEVLSFFAFDFRRMRKVPLGDEWWLRILDKLQDIVKRGVYEGVDVIFEELNGFYEDGLVVSESVKVFLRHSILWEDEEVKREFEKLLKHVVS